jgi:predicted nucleic acid-binding protein
MDTNAILALILGLTVRLGLPLLVTLLVVIGLRRLDIRWQKEAALERDLLVRDEEPCWKEQGLSMEEIKARAAQSGKPCWQIHRLSNGYLREACLDCEIFINAPAPALKPSKVHA